MEGPKGAHYIPPWTTLHYLFYKSPAFNGGIFLVSVLWGSYNVGRGIVGTAQEGAVLGNKMSTVWLPIRMVTGIAGVVPVFAGFNLAQVVHVLTTGIGIGLANMMFLGAINLAGSQFQSMFHPETARPTTGRRGWCAPGAASASTPPPAVTPPSSTRSPARSCGATTPA